MPLISPVLLGFVTAFVTYPFYNFIRLRLRLWPSVAALFVTLFIAVVFVGPFILVGITVAKEGSELATTVNAQSLLRSYERLIRLIPANREHVQEAVTSIVSRSSEIGTQLVTSIMASLPKLLLGAVFYLISLYYGFVDGPRLAEYVRQALPFPQQESSAIFTTTEQICRGVALGSLISAVAQASIIGLFYYWLNIPGAMLFATLTAFMSFVPALGAGPTGWGGVIYLWAQGNTSGVMWMLLGLGIASISDNVVKPWVLKGGSASLHPLLGLMGALGGLMVFGIAGLILGPLFAALGVVMVDVLRRE